MYLPLLEDNHDNKEKIMSTNPLIDQEFTIAIGDTMEDIVKFLKKKDYNVFVAIAALEIAKQNLITETVKKFRVEKIHE